MPERADKTQAYRILRTQESKIIDRYRVTDGEKFRLKDYDPADTAGHQSDKPLARALLEGGVQRLSEQQEKLYAQDRWGMLCCFQAMDAAGKDGTIKRRTCRPPPRRDRPALSRPARLDVLRRGRARSRGYR
jgi:polyphosphate kinase 2 (PPK2 family)